jgi:hypothetical protein
MDSEPHFHNHVNYLLSQCNKLLDLARRVTFSFSSFHRLHLLHFTLVKSKLQYATVVSSFITSTDANKLERIQQKFAALCFNSFFPHAHYSYAHIFEHLKLHTFCKRRYHIVALVFSNLPWF